MFSTLSRNLPCKYATCSWHSYTCSILVRMTTMRCLRPSGGGARRQCPHLAAFCSSLVEGLAHLESTLDGGGGGGSAVSMRWCADAMRLVKRMQRELLAVFRSAGAPVTVDSACGGGGGGDWLEQYMQETAALLDFCNAFKCAVARMHRYCMVVDFAAQVGRCAGGSNGDDAAAAVAASLVVAESAAAPCGGWMEESSTDAVGGELSDVKAVVSETERLGRKIMSSSSGGGGGGGTMVLVTLVAKITMAVVSTSVLHALTTPPSPLAVGSRRCTLGRAAVPEQLRPWRESLSAINDRLSSLPASVAEHENVATAVRRMLDGKMEAGGADHEHHGHVVELLRTRSGELREGVEVFDCVLDQVFDEVLKGRNEMLGIFRDKALT